MAKKFEKVYDKDLNYFSIGSLVSCIVGLFS
jgi:hypothetical protein